MSAAAVYNLPNMSSSQYGSPAERGALLDSLRTSPRIASLANQQQLQQQQQQQMQMAHMQAMYQQQQYELAQQQAALELQLQLEQFRLQNLALQEQIMLGQAAQAQAQAEAEAVLQHRLSERNIYTAPQKFTALGSRGFVATQGGVLAERAFTRRTRHQDQQQQPQNAHAHRRQSSTRSCLSSTSPYDPHASTPALILSKPGEAFPASSPVATHKHSDSEASSSVSSAWSSLEAFMHSEGQGSDDNTVDSPPSEVTSFASSGSTKQSPPPPLATEGAWEPTIAAASAAAAPEIVTPKAKLNPFSSVFVPASKAQQKANAAASAHGAVAAPIPLAPQAGVYRAPRSGSPTMSGICPLGSLAGPRSSPAGGGNVSAAPIRQPKGPPSHAEELDAQNFNSRLRKRAMNTIRNMNLAPRSPTSPSTGLFGSTFEYQQQQQVLPGLATLLHATKAREERAWKSGDVLF